MDGIEHTVARCDRLLEVGRPAEALDILLGDSRTPTDADALVSLSRCYHQLDRDQEALRTAEASLAMNPEHADGWLMLAVCKLAIGLPVEALPAARRGVELAPWFFGAHSITSRVLADLGRFPQARFHADKTRELDPDGPSGWIAACRVDLAQQQWEQAALSATRALSRDPENDEARVLLSVAQHKSSRPSGRDQAMSTLVGAVRDNPDQDGVRQYLIEVALDRKPRPRIWLSLIAVSLLSVRIGLVLFLITVSVSMFQLRSSIPTDIRALIWADRPTRYKIIAGCVVVGCLWLVAIGALVGVIAAPR